MIRVQPGTFRIWPFNGDPASAQNLIDDSFVTTAITDNSQWTNGATLIDRIDFLRPETDDAKIIGFTVSAKVSLFQPNAGQKLFGKFGKILAGITMQGDPTQQSANLPFVPGVNSLPADLSLIAPIWDPVQDSLPPTIDTANVGAVGYPGLQTGVVQTLPQPIPLVRGTAGVAFGIWILPSLLASTQPIGPVGNQVRRPCVQLCVSNAAYTVVYDDGMPEPA